MPLTPVAYIHIGCVLCTVVQQYRIHSRLNSPFSCHINKKNGEKKKKDRCRWISPKMRVYFILWNLISKMLTSEAQDTRHIYSFIFLFILLRFLFRLMKIMNACWKRLEKNKGHLSICHCAGWLMYFYFCTKSVHHYYYLTM